MKLPNKNSHQVFKTRRVRYARADELELYSSSVIEASHGFLQLRVPMILVRLNKGSCH